MYFNSLTRATVLNSQLNLTASLQTQGKIWSILIPPTWSLQRLKVALSALGTHCTSTDGEDGKVPQNNNPKIPHKMQSKSVRKSRHRHMPNFWPLRKPETCAPQPVVNYLQLSESRKLGLCTPCTLCSGGELSLAHPYWNTATGEKKNKPVDFKYNHKMFQSSTQNMGDLNW